MLIFAAGFGVFGWVVLMKLNLDLLKSNFYMSSTERFGYEWDKYSLIDKNYESQFKNWIYPLSEGDFKNKNILDAGCGMGRNSYWCLKWGADKITAFDFDQRSVKAARSNLKNFNNAEVIYKSIYNIDWHNEFDLVFSIGVIHHLKNPKVALKNLFNALKPCGSLLIWVYSYEGNEWIVKYVNPVRIYITSKLPLPLVHVLSYLFSIPLWVIVKIFKAPTDYLKQLANFKFWHIQSIVFDQLIPRVANYWSKQEVIELVDELNLTEIKIQQPPNKCGWVLIGKKL